jgi:hypothetical protein
MPVPGPSHLSPASADEAMALVRAGLAYLATADARSLPADTQAGLLRDLEKAESQHTAARARVLSAFCAAGAYELDACRSPRSWLAWQTRITSGAAGGAIGWMRRLDAHPRVADALAAEEISESWARQICDWTDGLPEEHRDSADQILLAAAAGGADLADLAGLAEEIHARCAPPDSDGDDAFTRRGVSLDLHYQGAGKLSGNLTPECAAAVKAVLDSLGKKVGPEDDRTAAQRRHDALEEAFRRLVGAGGLPDVAGQPAQIMLHATLEQMLRLQGAAAAHRAWLAGRAAADGEPGWLSDAAAEGYACDATITPIVTGHVDPAALAAMTAEYLSGQYGAGPFQPAGPLQPTGPSESAAALQPDGPLQARGPGQSAGPAGPAGHRDASGPARLPLPPRTTRRLQDTLLRYAADVLSGPTGLAAYLRAHLLDFPAMVSLPLDTGTPTPVIPAHLRRAIITRDRHCSFAGCTRPPSQCHIHHMVPRSRGGTTSLGNCRLFCDFHHLTVIHRWGWTVTANADGTTTATSPDGFRTLHSHGPPGDPPDLYEAEDTDPAAA